MELDSAAQDMLKELGNIGTGNAITALSAMLGKEIVMECPQVRVVGFNEVPDTLGGMEAIDQAGHGGGTVLSEFPARLQLRQGEVRQL